MRLPRFRVRTLLIAIGVLAVLLGGRHEYLSLSRLSTKYRYIAWAIGNDVQSGLGQAKRMRKLREQLKASIDAKGGPMSDADRALFDELTMNLAKWNMFTTASVNLVRVYEHAAGHPWEDPPQIAPPAPGSNWTGESEPLIQRFLGPPKPAPPIPPEFVTPPDTSPPPIAPPDPQSASLPVP
jgi:hypothetical protein